MARLDAQATREYLKAYRATDGYRARRRELRQRPDARTRIALEATKQRASKLGVPFALSVGDIQIPDRCPVLGLPLARKSGMGPSDSSPSLDRIIGSDGYVKGNVNVISTRANRIKSNSTDPRELAAVAEYTADQLPLKELVRMAGEF